MEGQQDALVTIARPPRARTSAYGALGGRKPSAKRLKVGHRGDRQKLMIKKASLAQSRLLFVVNGLRRLLDDEHFVTLLRAEAMHTLPKPLAERLGVAEA
jgi:hypothetical protein